MPFALLLVLVSTVSWLHCCFVRSMYSYNTRDAKARWVAMGNLPAMIATVRVCLSCPAFAAPSRVVAAPVLYRGVRSGLRAGMHPVCAPAWLLFQRLFQRHVWPIHYVAQPNRSVRPRDGARALPGGRGRLRGHVAQQHGRLLQHRLRL